MLAISTASVVVLNPPAVELGGRDKHKNGHMVITDASESFVKSTVLKPAVRAVTDWKKAAIIL